MELMQTVLQEISGVLERVKPEELSAVADCIQKQHRIFVDGEGRSGLMAKGFAMRLMHLGYQAYVVGETITPAVSQGDVFIAVSGSGESAYVVSDAKKAKEKGCTVVAVTSKPESTVAKAASAILTVPGTVRGDGGESRGSIQLLSSLFDQSLHITLDVLCLMLSRRDHTSNDTATGKHW
ncbi:6-phospho-3-hexuloisomerase [Hydrogenoanaerobacterium sp.]|uniref:6-phospho-3-hexuloisomerase n=1 Tax=Hydrogenoanaerobacterium sp. TaxID=2953763 RepID=UPI00289BCFFE|nr:6-phospho-3-hexuloisomerase [Hydrogenoanaerobacterium sp.]